MRPGFLSLPKILSAALGLSVLFALHASPALGQAVPWWDNNYADARQVTLTSGSLPIPSGTLVSVTFDHASLVSAGSSLASGNDVRLVFRSGGVTTEIVRALANGSSWNSATTKLMFKTQAAIPAASSDGNYFLYYGNPAAGAPAINGVPSARYFKSEQLVEQSTISTTFVDVPGTTLTFLPGETSETWLIFATGVLRSDSINNITSEMHLLVNGVEVDYWGQRNKTANTPNGSGFLIFHRITGTATVQTLQLQFRSGGGTTFASSVRLVAALLPQGADFQFADAPAALQLPKGTVNASLLGLSFTPSSAGDYFIFGEVTHDDPGGGVVQSWVEDDAGNLHPDAPAGTHFSNPFNTLASATVAFRRTLPASGRTFTLRGTAGGNNGSIWQYRRLMAFRADAWESAEYSESLPLSTSVGAAFQTKTTLTTAAPPAARDYLVVQLERLSGTSDQNLQKSGELRDGGAAILRTNHRIDQDGSTAGYHSVAGVANVKTTSAAVSYLNGFQSSVGGDTVECAESVIMAMRYLEPSAVSQRPLVRDLNSTAANGTYGLGALLPIQVRFSEPVTVTGTPQLTLETGAVDRVLTYASGSGTNTLTFNYTVTSGDTSPDLDALSAAAFALSGAVIQDSAGLIADVTLPAPGTPGSLGANKALVIDGILPSAPGTPSGLPNPNNTGTFTVSWTAATDTGGAGTGAVKYTVQRSSDGGTTWTTAATGVAGTSFGESGLAEGQYVYRLWAVDLAGNAGPLSGVSSAVVVDKTPPTVTSIIPTNSSPTNLGTVGYTVTFSESVVGVDAADFTVSSPGLSGAGISNVSGSGTTWTVSLSTGSGNGTLQLAVAGAPSIADTAGNPLVGPFPTAATYTVDKTAPTILSVTSSTAAGTYKAGASINVTVNFSEPVSLAGGNLLVGLNSGGTVTISPFASATSVSGTYTVGAGQNTPALDASSPLTLSAGTLRDAAGNDGVLTIPVGQNISNAKTIVIDTTAPTVSSINFVGPNPTNAASVNFTVTFSEPVLNVASGNFSLNTTGVTTPSITSVSGSGTTWTVAVNTGSGSGTIRVDLTAAGISDVAGNALAGVPYFAGQTLTIDKAPPTITNVTSTTAPGSYKAGAVINVTVNFSKAVTLNGGNLLVGLNTLATVTISPITSSTTASGAYTVGAGENTPALNAGSPLTLSAGTLRDAAGNDCVLTIPVGQNIANAKTIVIDTTPPTVTSIALGGSSPTNAASVNFAVTFSESVTNVTAASFSLTTTGVSGASIGVPSGSGTMWTVPVNTGSGDGTIRLDATAPGTTVDLAGNPLSGLSFTAGQTYTIDKTAPTVSSIVRAIGSSNPTNAASVNFTVTFSEAVSGASVTASSFSLVTTGVTGASVGTPGGSGNQWTIPVNTGTGDGTIQLAISGSPAITDPAGNAVAGPFPAGEVFTIDKTPPTVVISAPSSSTATTGPVSYTVTYSGADAVTLAAGNVTLLTTGTASGTVSVTGSGTTTRTVTLSSLTGTGTLAISIAAGTASDLAGNSAPAAGPSASVNVNNSGSIALPTLLQVESLTNPTFVTRSPGFSAQYNWTGPSPLDAVSFSAQVSTDSSFSTITHWNSPSGGVLFPGSVSVPAGSRTPQILYGTGGDQSGTVPLLSWNQQYFWRIQLKDTAADLSGYSTEVASFVMSSPSADTSANGNGDPSAASWRYVGFPIAVGTSVPATELLNTISYCFRWEEPTRQWVQLTAGDVIEGGRGYLAYAAPGMVLTLNSGSVALGNQPINLTYTTLAAPAGPEITEGRPTNYYRGAHFLANPFNAPISWDDPPSGLVEKPNLSSTYFKWDGTQYLVYNSATQLGSAGSTIVPFQAFGVNVLADTPEADVIFDAPAAGAFPAPHLAGKPLAAFVPAANAWALNLVATSGTAVDTENYVGINPAASDTWDVRDAEEPGHGSGTWVLLYFDHNDWVTRPHWYTHDYRQTRYNAGDEIVWVASVDANTGAPVVITWPNINLMPKSDWQYFIEDPVAGTSVDMTTTSSIQIGPLTGVATLNIRAKRLTSSPGSLGIAALPQGATPSSVTAGTSGVPMLTLDVTAGGEAITVGQWEVHHSGTGDPSKVLVSLYNGLVRVAGPSPFGAGGAVLWSGFGQVVADGEHQTWTVVYDFAADGTGTYRATVDADEISGVGNTSGKTITPPPATFDGVEVTVTAGAGSGVPPGVPGGTSHGKKRGCGLLGVEILIVATIIRGKRRLGGSKRVRS